MTALRGHGASDSSAGVMVNGHNVTVTKRLPMKNRPNAGGGAAAALLLMAVLACSGCSSAAPSCEAAARSDLADFSRQLESAGVAAGSEVVDDCGSGGSFYADLELGNLTALDNLATPPWSCRALVPAELDAPYDDVGFTCQHAARTYEVSAGKVGGQAQGQVWAVDDLTDD